MTLLGLIRQTYPSPEWAVFQEVGVGTRYADAVALGIWQSRGYTLVGFEFKEHRGDWLRELKNPAKAESVAGHVDGFYLVAGNDGVAKVEELPEPWGLYVANADRTKLKCVKKCQWFPDRDKTIVKRHFVAAMLRRVSENTVPKSEMNAIVEVRVKEALERAREGRELEMLRERLQKETAALDTFAQITGIDLRRGYQGPEKIALAVKAVLEGDREKLRIEYARQALADALKTMEAALVSWPQSDAQLALAGQEHS